LRSLPEFRDPYIGETFGLIIFFSDDFFTLKADNKASTSSTTTTTTSRPTGRQEEREDKAKRFFRIARKLPMELQMMLCNRMFNSPKDLVLRKDSEPAFKRLAKLATLTQ
jgi:hypothetical protein